MNQNSETKQFEPTERILSSHLRGCGLDLVQFFSEENEGNLRTSIEGIIILSGATIIDKNVKAHYFNPGLTMNYLLAESHFSIHISPQEWEDKSVTLHIATCGEIIPIVCLGGALKLLKPREAEAAYFSFRPVNPEKVRMPEYKEKMHDDFIKVIPLDYLVRLSRLREDLGRIKGYSVYIVKR
ncbi:hypothetical protein AUJ10_01235 [Candidatus Pacearchaeota archaeon CG1_02_31_27]|nr:MAG: hypothetical protein AUJ10_01235 [Candidatus Pacearchaeota archaeon CG1_02_31_27]PIN92037.1 MAG: hypothetical protein COU55_03180 [Candidatus Pacearchaeota archaeon CG10_big_fil_rev_8_21_14_0_10_31_59]PIZ81121.1 MAG: hypothetical protein COX99_00790 [Candidatus Pacearchaeota archaeon CG_4_10_14_0_2_um_filter_31_10]